MVWPVTLYIFTTTQASCIHRGGMQFAKPDKPVFKPDICYAWKITDNGQRHGETIKLHGAIHVKKKTIYIIEIWNSLPESVKQFEIGLDEHWKHQECKYDFMANINIRSNSGSDVKSCIKLYFDSKQWTTPP
jgi:hypothetical protein